MKLFYIWTFIFIIFCFAESIKITPKIIENHKSHNIGLRRSEISVNKKENEKVKTTFLSLSGIRISSANASKIVLLKESDCLELCQNMGSCVFFSFYEAKNLCYVYQSYENVSFVAENLWRTYFSTDASHLNSFQLTINPRNKRAIPAILIPIFALFAKIGTKIAIAATSVKAAVALKTAAVIASSKALFVGKAVAVGSAKVAMVAGANTATVLPAVVLTGGGVLAGYGPPIATPLVFCGLAKGAGVVAVGAAASSVGATSAVVTSGVVATAAASATVAAASAKTTVIFGTATALITGGVVSGVVVAASHISNTGSRFDIDNKHASLAVAGIGHVSNLMDQVGKHKSSQQTTFHTPSTTPSTTHSTTTKNSTTKYGAQD